MNPADLLTRAHELGVTLRADGPDLVVRFKSEPPEQFVLELRRNKSSVLALLSEGQNDDPVACRGCAAIIPAGTTLCTACGAKHSPLVRFALELAQTAPLRTLRGDALAALDRRRYPRLQLDHAQTAGPGLIAWCPVLRDADAATLRKIIRLAEKAPKGSDDD